jgi:hypothetical protein
MMSMLFLVCIRCGHRLTATIVEVPLPPEVVEEAPSTRQFLPARMPSGTYAVSQETGGFVLNSHDVTGTKLHPDPRRRNGCCRLDGLDGPNLVCSGCAAETGTEQSDCWSQQQVVMLPDAVDLVTGDRQDSPAHRR